jgi:hypothetical protein
MSVGGSLPTVMVGLTNTSTSAWSPLAGIDAAAGKLATAEICFCFDPGHHVVGQSRVGILEFAGQSVPGGADSPVPIEK